MSAQPARSTLPTPAQCPTCDQPIPNDRLSTVAARIEARDRETSAGVTARLREQFARDMGKYQSDAKAELEQHKQQAAEKEAIARAAGRAEAQEELRAQEAQFRESIAALESNDRASQEALATLRIESTSKLEELRAEVAQREEIARGQGRSETEANFAAAVAAAEQAKIDAEEGRQQALDQLAVANSSIEVRLAEQREALEAKAAEAVDKAEERVANIEAARIDAVATAKAAEEAARALKASAEEELASRLAEQRAALERASSDAVNAEKAKAFDVQLKLETQLQDITRQLQKKTADELGEGAEVDLFEELLAAFEGDKIERIEKGQPGADIVHDVIHNGIVCGRIVYDSKNRTAWRNDYVTKLRADQLAHEADHAIMSSLAFPSGSRQIHFQEGVIVCNPARAAALADIVRNHVIQIYAARASSEEREEKTAALYDFITSERCAQLLERIDTSTDNLLDLDVKEKKAHDLTWKKRGELIKGVAKAQGELSAQISAIIGTAEPE